MGFHLACMLGFLFFCFEIFNPDYFFDLEIQDRTKALQWIGAFEEEVEQLVCLICR